MVSGVVTALQAEYDERVTQLETLESEWAGKAYSVEAKQRYNDLNESIEEFRTKIELAKRDVRKKEIEDRAKEGVGLESPSIRRPGAVEDGLVFDLSTVRADWTNPEATARELKDRAQRAVEKAQFPGKSREDAQTRCAQLLAADTTHGSLARHMLVTGSPAYKRAFGKYLNNSYLDAEEAKALQQSRAISLTGTSGGFAVPFELDPTIIPTSNLAINPFRAISRVESITVDEWRGVSSGAVTAFYGAEAIATTTDSAPTLAQPTISTEKAQSFIPFSIEIGMDWNGLQAEMGKLLQDAKDVLEATMFVTGSGTNQPYGVITGATAVTTAAATNAVVIADIYKWQSELAPRFRPNAVFVISNKLSQTIRQFDTSGGAGLWIDNLKLGLASNQVPTPGGMQAQLLGYPVYEATGLSTTYTTGQLLGVYGDFSYYVIVDRIGLTVETIPHLFDVTNNYPTGQRGLYAYWRNSAKVVDAAGFRTLKLA